MYRLIVSIIIHVLNILLDQYPVIGNHFVASKQKGNNYLPCISVTGVLLQTGYVTHTHTRARARTHICTLRFAGITEVFQFCCITFVCVVSYSAHVNGATCIFQLQRAVQTTRNPKITAPQASRCAIMFKQCLLPLQYWLFATNQWGMQSLEIM